MSEALRVERPTAPAWLQWLTLLLIFVAPGQLAHALDPKHGPFIAYADVLAVLVGGLFFLWVLFGRHWRRILWPPLPAWAWLIVAILSAAGAESLKAAALEIIQLALYFGLVYMLFVNVLVAEARQRMAVLALLASTTLVVAYGVVQYATASEPMAVTSLFQSRTAYSGFLTLALPLFFGLTLWSELTWERLWTGLLTVAGAVTMLAPPLVWVLAIVLVVMAVAWGRERKAVTVGLAAGVFLLVTVSFLPLNRQVFREMLNPFEEGPIYKVMEAGGEGAGEAPAGPIIKKRWIEWMPSLNMLGEHFMLGVGTGNYQQNIGQPEYYGFLPNVKKSEPDTNNLYLVIGGSMGLAGLVCLMAFLGYFWQSAGRLWMHAQTHEARALACGLYGACTALLIANLFTSVLVRGTALVWALVCALVASMTHEKTSA